jgi:capsular exopolysaccharide synthesis family protein
MKKLNGSRGLENEFTEIEPYYAAESEAIAGNGFEGIYKDEDEKLIIWKFFGSIRKHWLLILTVNFVITGAVIFYLAQKPDFYQAQVRVQVNAEMNPAAGITSNGGSIIVNQANDPAYFSTQLQIIEGPGLLRRVAKNLDLENNQLFLNPQGDERPTAWQNVKRLFGLYQKPGKSESNQDSKNNPERSAKKNLLSLNENEGIAVSNQETEKLAPFIAILQRDLTVAPVWDNRTHSGQTRLIEISYTHGDPEMAAKIVNEIADVYVQQNLENKIKSNSVAGDFLQNRVAELQSLIRRGEERLMNYSKSNQIVSLNESQNTVVQRFADLNQQVGAAENARIAAQTTYQAALQNKMRETVVQSQDPQVVGLENKLGELRQRLAQLKTEYTDEWYEVVQTKQQIGLVENQLVSLRKRATDIQLATLEERLNDSIARERVLREEFEKQRGEVVKQNEASINYRILEQDINTNKKLLSDLLERSKENDLILTRTPNNLQVVDPAVVPTNAVGPQRARYIALAFIISLIGAIGFAFVIDWFNDSVQHSEDIENIFGLPLLAAIPTAPMLISRKLLPSRLRKRNGLMKNYNLKAFDKTHFQEAYLQLGTRLLLSRAGGPPQTVLVTSGEEGEGKTLTALNLAKSLAETGRKVLLIDTDLRCPKLHKLLDINNHVGITNLLTAENLSAELIEQSVSKNAAGNLDILTSGVRPVNPAALVGSKEMSRLLKKLSENYAHIILDSPPVHYFADSLMLSTITDVTIIVVRDNHSSRQAVLQVKKVLQTVNAEIIGIVMNGVPLRWAAYDKYRDYDSGEELPELEGDSEILKIK